MNFRESLVSKILKYPVRFLIAFNILIFCFAPGFLNIKEDYSYRAWYSEDDPLLINYDQFESKFGNDDAVVMGVKLEGEKSLFNPTSLKLIYELTERMWSVPTIIRVDSLANYDFIEPIDGEIEIAPLISEELIEEGGLTDQFVGSLKEKIQSNKLIENVLISKDGKMALVRAKVRPFHKGRNDNQNLIFDVRSVAKEFSRDGHKVYIAGTATFIHIFKEIAEKDVMTLTPLLLSLILIILIYLYRNKSGVSFPFAVIIPSTLMMLGVAMMLGHKVTTISSAMPSILLTVAIADAVHILTVYFLGLKKGMSNQEAVRYTLIKNFYPTLLTSITTAIGFFSFSNSLIKSIGHLGVGIGFGVIFAWMATYFALGPLLVLRPKLTSKKKKALRKEIDQHKHQIKLDDVVFKSSTRTKSWVQFTYRNRYLISFTSVILVALSIFSARTLEINLNPDMQFPDDYPYKIAYNTMTKHYGPLAQVEFMVDAGGKEEAKDPEFLKLVEQYSKWLEKQDYIGKTISIVDIIKDINKTLNQNDSSFHKIPNTKEEVGQNLLFYSLGLPAGRELNDRISLDSDFIRLTATWNIINSKEANEKIIEMESKAKEMGLNATITGKMPLFHELTPYIVKSFIESFAIALTSITLILIFVLKSLKLGLLALIPNLFPLIIGTGLYALSGEYIDIGSVLIIAVSLGIAVDDSIHFLFEYQKFRKKNLSVTQSLENIFTSTAPSLFNTTILIVIGFGSFMLGDYVPNAKFGAMVAIILTVALLADFLILPAILYIMDKKTKPISDSSTQS